MFWKNIWFLRITSIIYLLFCLILAGLAYFVVLGEMIYWVTAPDGESVNFFDKLGSWSVLFIILSIINTCFSPFFVASIYLHFKYTNNRKFLKYTWFCLFNTFVEDFLLVRPIFLIIFIFKIWNKNNTKINLNNDIKHINTRSIVNFIYIIFLIVYFVTFSLLNNTEAVGWMSFCMIIYIIIPKLVMNSFIDIKFSNNNYSTKWIIIYLIASFFGIFPYCIYLSKNATYKIN